MDRSQMDKPTILYVEDDIPSQELVRNYLEEEYRYLVSTTSGEAKRLFEKHNIRLLLVDLSLAGEEDGLSLVRYLRKRENFYSLPIIAITTHAFTNDRSTCLKSGCNDYLAKPVSRKDLVEKITQLLRV